MARGPRSPRLSRVALYGGVDEREDPSIADARAQRKLRARGNGFSRQIHGGGTAMRVAAGPKGKVDGGRASSSIGRSSRAAGLFPVGGRSGSAAGLLPFGGVSGPRGASLPYQRRQRRTSASSSSMAASGMAQSSPIGGFTSHGGGIFDYQ